MKKVFLGGTCNDSKWREYLIPKLKMRYFNPVVDDWTPEAQQNEEFQKQICDYHLYVITPQMKGVYSIAEAVDDSNKISEKCIFCVLKDHLGKSFDESEMKSLNAVSKLIEANGGIILNNLKDVVKFINNIN